MSLKLRIIAGALLLSVTAAAPAVATDDQDIVAIQQVVIKYVAAFAIDARAASVFYGEPVLVVGAEGVQVQAKNEDTIERIGRAVGDLRTRGYAYTMPPKPQVRLLSTTAALCGIVAIRMRSDGSELERKGVTYLLHKDADGWRIHANIATDVDKVIAAN